MFRRLEIRLQHKQQHITVSIIFWPLFAYSSYNFYGAAICIKAVYSQNSQRKAFLGQKFLSLKTLIVFDFVLQKVSKR